MVKASVIIPVYNTELYLNQCIDSVRNQTLKEIEIICIDDGSTDSSLKILKEFEEKENRLILLQQQHKFAGAARNLGMRVAEGEYLYFLDSDDFLEINMLETVVGQCDQFNADIGLFDANRFNTFYKRYTPDKFVLQTRLLPTNNPFSYHDIKEHIFQISTSCPWNKIFKREFIKNNNLYFQEIHNANDVLFVNLALASAQKITVINKRLINYRVGYRVGHETNLQNIKFHYPLAFYEAFIALKEALIKRGIFFEVEQSFINLALTNSIYNFESIGTKSASELIYNTLQTEGFENLGIKGQMPDYFYSKHEYDIYLEIKKCSFSIFRKKHKPRKIAEIKKLIKKILKIIHNKRF